MIQLIQVFENESLRYTDSNLFTKKHFDAMVKFNELHQSKYFTIIHKGIRFKQYVGALQVGSLMIEILPKADNSRNINQDKQLWQSVLLHMLKVSKRVNTDTISEASLTRHYSSILEAYFDIFLNEVEQLVAKGLVKKYKQQPSNLTAIKGRLLFQQHVGKNIVHKERFYCRYPMYSKDHLLNQILLKALDILDSLSVSTHKDRVKRLLFAFENFATLTINQNSFQKIRLDRKTDPYRYALEIAKMIILNYSPGIKKGSNDLLALLFDMEKLWEDYVYEILQKNKPDGCIITRQAKQPFWNSKTIRPDILIQQSCVNYIIDTKWKLPKSAQPDDNDLKQIFAYNLLWKASHSLLLYPKVLQQDSPFGNYHYRHFSQSIALHIDNRCKMGFANLFQADRLMSDKEIAEEIFEKLNYE